MMYTIKVGMDIHNVEGRKVNRDGYVLLKIKTHPLAHPSGYILEHRVIYESIIGVYLDKEVVIHHMNGVKADNRFSNLQMMDRGKHTILHHKGAKRSDETKIRNSIASIKLGFTGSNHPMYKNVDEDVIELFEQGVPVMRIAELTGVTRRTIYNKISYLELER